MEKVILEQVKKFIKEVTDNDAMIALRKTTYVKGYQACVKDIDSLIKMGEEMGKRG